MWLYQRVMSPNNADGMANSVHPDQTAPLTGSALFAQTYLSENLGSLRYVSLVPNKGVWVSEFQFCEYFPKSAVSVRVYIDISQKCIVVEIIASNIIELNFSSRVQ